MDVAVCVLSVLAGARIMQIVGEVPMDLAVLAWGVLVSCIVATGILTGEWGQLFSRVVQAGGVRTPNYRSLRLFLSGAFLSLVGSAYSWFLVDHQTGLFIGLWVPSILALGALLNAAPGGGNRERP
jgi:hypothetical protein